MIKRSLWPQYILYLAIICAVLILGACTNPTPGYTPATGPAALPTVAATDVPGLSADQIATLNSLKKVDDHPLYTMHYYGGYEFSASVAPWQETRARSPPGQPIGKGWNRSASPGAWRGSGQGTIRRGVWRALLASWFATWERGY